MPTEPERRYFYSEIYVCLCLLLYGGMSFWEVLSAGGQDPSVLKLFISFLAIFVGLNGLFRGTFGRLLIGQALKVPVLRMWLKSPM